jgi:hypothetical protein
MSVLIEPNCIFCGRPTDRVEKWSMETYRAPGFSKNTKIVHTLTVPIPAHRLCYISRRWGSGFLGALIVGAILYTVSMFVAYLIYPLVSPANEYSALGFGIILVALFLPGIITIRIIRFFRTGFDRLVRGYHDSHIQKQ